MRTTLLLLALGGLAACSNAATTSAPATSAAVPPGSSAVAAPPAPTASPSPTPTASPAAGAPSLAADGKHFAAETKYQGDCSPPGSRGGCYSFTFKPDGSARHVLLDAADTGTYRIEGGAVIYRSASPDAKDSRIESKDGFRTLAGNYRYTP